MKTKITCILFLAFCLSLVGSSSGEIFIGNAEFEDVQLEVTEYTYNIFPWQRDDPLGYGYWAFVTYGYYGDEPVPLSHCLIPVGDYVFQPLSATYVDGAPYVFSIDVAVWDGADAWEIYFYDATDGDYLTHLATLSSTDPGEPIPFDWLEWRRKSITFTATAAEAGHQIGIGFWAWEWPLFDNATLEVQAGAYGPDPYDGEINVFTNKTLSWFAGRDPNFPASPNPAITYHEVYMSSGSPTDPNVSYVASIAAGPNRGEYTPAVELDDEATYYWRVDERLGSDPNVITGDVWMFETIGTIPVILDEPADALVDAGDDAVFTVVAVNPFTLSSDDLSYQWYKVGEPDEMLSNGADYSGVQTESLTVPDAQIADEDQYY